MKGVTTMKIKRLSKLLIFSLVLIIIFAGCSQSKTSSENAEGNKNGDSGEVTTVKVAIVATGNVSADFQKQIDRFNEKNKDVKAEILTFSSGDAYNQALMGQIAGGVA